MLGLRTFSGGSGMVTLLQTAKALASRGGSCASLRVHVAALRETLAEGKVASFRAPSLALEMRK